MNKLFFVFLFVIKYGTVCWDDIIHSVPYKINKISSLVNSLNGGYIRRVYNNGLKDAKIR